MVEKIFWQDPYLTKLITKVRSVIGDKITLEKTIFYAFSGGQESDAGTIGCYDVISAEKKDKEIYYLINKDHELKVGDTVDIEIDWDRRYQLMKHHFAAEVILELVYKSFPSIVKIGAHISKSKARIDFIFDQSLSIYINEWQNKAQDLVYASHNVISDFYNKEEEKRFWEIDGFSQVACGGTHIKNTKELGIIKLKRVNIGKNKERLEVKCL